MKISSYSIITIGTIDFVTSLTPLIENVNPILHFIIGVLTLVLTIKKIKND